ncbi:response regulator transcription factor [Methylovirgula sp. 4M-Z18]|uniref:response regulator transcription factor n=1 Tax=Methylovirgula sp. 4M-Z18 TaxID=2293567 RepID=UPI000E2F05A0|nr:response regulator [Methylovirgula sp. 4M-Z18]
MTRGQQTIFIVDRDSALRDSLKFALETEGFIVHVCRTGDDLKAHPFLTCGQCAVVEHMPPRVDGLAIVADLKSRGRDLPVILVTDRVTPQLRDTAKAAGVRHIVEKPLIDGSLNDHLTAILRNNQTT